MYLNYVMYMYVQLIGKNGPMLKTKVTDKPRVGWVYL